MRTHGAVLLIALAAALAVAGGALASTPGSDYRWAQPGTAPITTSLAQPPPSVPIVASTTIQVASAAVSGSSYDWTQPGTAPVTPSAQPAAWIPTG